MSEKSPSHETEIGQLVAKLSNFRTRAAAKRRLLEIGPAAVGALGEALESPNEGVAWAAAKTLGEIGVEEAADALEKALSRPGLERVAREALEGIRPAQPRPSMGLAKGAAVRNLSADALAKALSGGRISHRKHANGHTMTVDLPNGRSQNVELMALNDADGVPLVAFYTECGPADSKLYERALKLNLCIPFGAFAVRTSADGRKLVMVDAYLRETADVKQLKKSLETLAKRADAMEKELTGADEN